MMYWIKRGIKMGLVLSLVGGCTTTTGGYVHEKQSPGVYTERKAQKEEPTRIQHGTQKPKKTISRLSETTVAGFSNQNVQS